MMIDPKSFSCQQSRTGATSPGSVRAFTLIELMISIALVVILILGVSQVFQYTTQAVGAGEAVTAAIRSSRSAQTAFSRDFSAMVGVGTGNNDAPCLIIGSRAVYAFRDAKDQTSVGTISPNLTATNTSANAIGLPLPAYRDLDGDGNSGDPKVNGEIILPDNYNYRNHRIDTLSFFARNQFARQTGNLGTFVDALSSPEAWIWYGHLWLPDNNGNYPFATYPTGSAYPNPGEVPGLTLLGPQTFPGAGTKSTNPNNYFANQFTLGRQAIVLKEKSSDDQYGMIYDNAYPSKAQRFIDRSSNPYPNASATPPTYAQELEPLSSSSPAPGTTTPATTTGDTSVWYLQDGRYDLAATTMSAFRSKLSSYLDPANTYAATIATLPLWYDWMMDGSIYPNNGYTTRPFPAGAYTRFKCNPYLSKPMSAANVAQTSPYFLGGCSQFTVEFAGDFFTQDNDPTHTIRVPGIAAPAHPKYGDIIGSAVGDAQGHYKPDGQLDFFINANGVKQTIWYGLPRNTSGLTTTRAYSGASLVDGNPPNNLNGDVVPVRDWVQYVYDQYGTLISGAPGTNAGPVFETQQIPYYPGTNAAYPGTDYNQTMSLLDAQGGYMCAWSPGTPPPKIMLIRITMTLEDPTGRLPDGQTFQYVFPVTPSSTSK